MKRYINFLKKILILRRIKDGLFATRYFNKKYITNFKMDVYFKRRHKLYL